MRGMIVAAGLGTRLRPLSDLCPKPAMPVRGIPLIGYQLALLARYGVSEVMINAHAMSDLLIEAAERTCPPRVSLRFSVEEPLLDTGGGIRRVASFLRESDPCLVIGGDMVLDSDLGALVQRHRDRDAGVTLLLLDDPRTSQFGSIGVDAEGCLRRIGNRFDLGGEERCGLYAWANAFSPRAFDTFPDREVFSHLDDWLIPLLAAGSRDIRGEVRNPEECAWVPVGTPAEYLAANLEPWPVSYLDVTTAARKRGVRLQGDVVLGAGATLGAGASLKRVVVWDSEAVGDLVASDGVFAGGAFHPCATGGRATAAESAEDRVK